MKKILAVVLALAILCSMTACSKTVPEQSILYGKYLCYRSSIGGEIFDPDGEWIMLAPSGKGRLGISMESDMEWELDGNQLTFKALGGPYHGTLKNNEIILDWGGTLMYFAPLGRIEPSTEVSESTPFTEPTETDAPPELNYADAKVVDAVTKTFTFEDTELEYHVPEIIFDGEGIDYLNEIMYEQLFEEIYLKDVEEALDNYGIPGIAYMTYLWGRSDNFLSIVVTITYYASSGAEFAIYNIDLSTGELASDVEVLSHFSYTVDGFEEEARDVMGSVLFDQYATFIEEYKSESEMMAEFDSLVNRTTSVEYVSDACPFVGADGRLWMVAPIASIAGADRYEQVIAVETYPISDAYLNYIAD